MWFIDPELYTYHLPQERIAMFPADRRDNSRLLFYHKGRITHHIFKDIPSLLPENSLLVLNDTRVIPARLHFKKSNGVLIEIFLLRPVSPTGIMAKAMTARNETVWQCMIGNLKRWHDHKSLVLVTDSGGKDLELTANFEDPGNNLVKFSWNDPSLTFSDIIRIFGKVPLPPYIHRETIEEDTRRYQTIYSRSDGAVASSTAGLHFTGDTLESLEKSGIKLGYVTLHVGAGTFQPIKEKNAVDHDMHSEQVIISENIIEELISHQGPVIAAGTTVMRALESVYWYGVKILSGGDEFNISKLDPYDRDPKTLPPVKDSYKAVREKISGLNTDTIIGETSIYVLPGYNFKTCNGLLTNFHLPGSTLIMLVAAFAGNDWRRIYTEAILKDYRFLSYGDASLILPDRDL